MRIFNSHEVLAILKEYNITESIQMVTQYLREGKIKAERTENRKDGYLIYEEDLYDFIEEKRPGWTAVMAVYDEYIDQLDPLGKKAALPTLSKELEKVTNNYEPEKTRQLENKIIELDENCGNLEYQILELLQENISLKEEIEFLKDFFDVHTDEINELTKKNKELLREFSSLKSMYVALMEQFTQPTQQVVNTESTSSTEKIKKKSVKPRDNSKANLSFIDFCKIVNNVKFELKVEDEIGEEEQREVYFKLFTEDEQIKPERLTEDGQFLCPYTNYSYKQKMRFIKSAATYMLQHRTSTIRDEPEIDKNGDSEG